MNAAQTDSGSAGAGAGGTGGGGSRALGGGFGPSGSPGADTTGDHSTGSTGSGASGAYSIGTAESETWNDISLNDAQGVTEVGPSTFDTTQRYEPYTYHENAGFQRVDPPKNAEWLTEKGGFDRLNEATDQPLRFKGENDGQMYDLSDLGQSGPSYSPAGNSGAETIRDT
jgi:hypothetical protein